MSLISTMIKNPNFNYSLGEIKPESLIPIDTNGLYHSWTYGKGPFWTDEIDVGDALGFANIHNLLQDASDEWQDHPVFAIGDELGLSGGVCPISEINYMDEGNESVRKLNMEIHKTGFIKNTVPPTGGVVVMFEDNIEVLYDMDSVTFPWLAHVLTGKIDNITLMAMQYTIINLGIVLEKEYYWDLERVTRSGEFSMLHLKPHKCLS